MSPLSNDPERRERQLQNLVPGHAAAGLGNRRAVQHGAYATLAPDRVDEKVREIFDALATVAPVRESDGGLPPADVAAVRQLADTLLRIETIGEYLSRKGWEGEDGKPRPILEFEARLRAHSLELMRELGMTPAARARLGLDITRIATAGEKLDEHLQQRYGGQG